jgi:nucleotide-binding universal stress UspA family protein
MRCIFFHDLTSLRIRAAASGGADIHPEGRQDCMYRKIAVAYNESPEAEHALVCAIRLAKCLGAELSTITVAAELPAYTAFAGAADPSLSRVLANDQEKFYVQLEEKARATAQPHGVNLLSHIVEGREVEAIVSFLRRQKTDLLVVGLHQRNLYLARLWSTVYELAQEAPCSVLGVH